MGDVRDRIRSRAILTTENILYNLACVKFLCHEMQGSL